MRVTYRWLQDYVAFDLTPPELAHRLTMAGFEVEDLRPVGGGYTGVVTALIEKVDRHPEADKLTVCAVFDGVERFQVICGAPNVVAGKVGVLARIGAQLPEGKLKKSKIRGVESFGMLCSRRELGLSEDHSGIWLLPPETPLGREPLEAAGLDDWSFEIAVTPNRPDALSVIGLAREVAALTGGRLKMPALALEPVGGEIDRAMTVEIVDPDKCPRYCGMLVKGVRIAPSPLWMVHRLEAAGVRAINNIVDITNFVLLEYGQPLHAFDYDFLAGRKIVVRRARDGETIVTLDDQPRRLTADDLLICDGEKPVALAGIMGGQNSLVTDRTVDVFIEAAYFQPSGIRRTSKRLGLMSESSHRFERGTAIDYAVLGAHRAARLMAELASGTVESGYIDNYPALRAPQKVAMRVGRVNDLIGVRLSADRMSDLLSSIELKVVVKTDERLEVEVPSFRVDLEREVDLAEEIARLYGIDNIPPTIHLGADFENKPWRLRPVLRVLRQELVGMGLTELNTLPFLDPASLAAVGAPEGIRLLNPLSEELAIMRTTLLPSLLKVLAYNQARNVLDVQVFEARRVYLPKSTDKNELPDEPYRLGLLLSGRRDELSWAYGKENVDFFDLKGLVERLLILLRIPGSTWRRPSASGPYLPGVSAELLIGEKPAGIFGKLRSEVLEKFEIRDEAFAGELYLDVLSESTGESLVLRPVSKYPPMLRDLAVLADAEAPVDEMVRAIAEINPARISEVKVFDVYTGKGIPEGKKSVAFSMRYQDVSKSLSDKDADGLTRRILMMLQERWGATLRE
ncbi:MAG: phenylalanine--tRNA ligase subunit beta [Myxococcales bacterium]|nr:phenylalanine--tRNA ligase subunit beta [Myxococcales bacterium]